MCLHPKCASNILTNVCYTSGSVQSQIYRNMSGCRGQSPGTPHTLEDVANKLRDYKRCQSSSPGVRCHHRQLAGESGPASHHSARPEGGAAWRAGVHPYRLGA